MVLLVCTRDQRELRRGNNRATQRTTEHEECLLKINDLEIRFSTSNRTTTISRIGLRYDQVFRFVVLLAGSYEYWGTFDGF